MVISLLSVFVASILVVASHTIAGRLVALLSTALFAPMLAYFTMPPYLSFRVSETHDVILIACFGVMGLIVARSPRVTEVTRRSSRTERIESRAAARVTKLSSVVEALMATDTGTTLRASGIPVDSANILLPCSDDEALVLLQSVFDDSRQVQQTRRISILGGRKPGVFCLYVAAHRVWPTPADLIVEVGRHPDRCTPITFPACSARIRAGWFDNGYDRVYQIFFDQSSESA